jgi:L-ascorbate metabolism protein UlaG (beta-lactamase superfamily)
VRITSLGHAALLVQTVDCTVLVDPVFMPSLGGGILEYRPAREFDLARLPAPTALVISHLHFDHCDPPSLEQLDRTLPVVLPADDRLAARLRDIGFRDLRVCHPWQTLQLGQTRLTATPSAHEEPEFGIVISDESGSFWDMVDSNVTVHDARSLARALGPIDVVAAKYQPVVQSGEGYLRCHGAAFDKSSVVEWLEAACAVDPALVFPFASGLRCAGRHEWFNRFAFAYEADEIAHLLRRRLDETRVAVVDAGDVIEIARGVAPAWQPQRSPFVRTVRGEASRPRWEPVDLSTLAGIDDPGEREELESRLHAFIVERLQPWVREELAREGSALGLQRDQGVVWQLHVELGAGARLDWCVDYGRPAATIDRGRHPFANDFTHVSGRMLLDVLRGDAPGLFWLIGDARSYEKTIGIVDGRLFARPAGKGDASTQWDPLTWYLRHIGPEGWPRPTDGGAAEAQPRPAEAVAPAGRAASGDPAIESADGSGTSLLELVRPGGNPGVRAKKVLLCLLAHAEAARGGFAPEAGAVQDVSDTFRRQFGLESSEAVHAWLQSSGLSVEQYTRAMTLFAAVAALEAREAPRIEALLDTFDRIATAASAQPQSPVDPASSQA